MTRAAERDGINVRPFWRPGITFLKADRRSRPNDYDWDSLALHDETKQAKLLPRPDAAK